MIRRNLKEPSPSAGNVRDDRAGSMSCFSSDLCVIVALLARYDVRRRPAPGRASSRSADRGPRGPGGGSRPLQPLRRRQSKDSIPAERPRRHAQASPRRTGSSSTAPSPTATIAVNIPPLSGVCTGIGRVTSRVIPERDGHRQFLGLPDRYPDGRRGPGRRPRQAQDHRRHGLLASTGTAASRIPAARQACPSSAGRFTSTRRAPPPSRSAPRLARRQTVRRSSAATPVR